MIGWLFDLFDWDWNWRVRYPEGSYSVKMSFGAACSLAEAVNGEVVYDNAN